MADIGDVVGREIKKNRDSDAQTLQIQIEIADGDDVRTAELYRPAGVDTSPRNGSRALIINIGKSWQVAVACDDESTSEVDAGDLEIYALDADGNRKGKVRCKSDGDVVVNDGLDYGVQFTALNLAFEQLKSEVIAAQVIFNAHVHGAIGVPTPPITSPTVTPQIAPTANISNAKINTFRVP